VTGEPDDKRIAVSLDDGYEHYLKVLPRAMEEYGVKVTIFVPTEFIGQENNWDYSFVFQRSRHLDRAAIKELTTLGANFGSHGHSHQPLTRLTDEKLRSELETSRKTLEDITGKGVDMISYPFGRVDRRIMDAAGEAGYSQGFTMAFPVETDHRLARGRLAVYGFDTFFTVRQKISGGLLYTIEKMKAAFANRLSAGTGIYRRLSGR
jgi:peptidoglycan/xylan/chitin deacetylase (PgdA/CDA1 family)